MIAVEVNGTCYRVRSLTTRQATEIWDAGDGLLLTLPFAIDLEDAHVVQAILTAYQLGLRRTVTMKDPQVYTCIQREGRTHWMRIGSARWGADRLDVHLDALPVNGTLCIRDEDTCPR